MAAAFVPRNESPVKSSAARIIVEAYNDLSQPPTKRYILSRTWPTQRAAQQFANWAAHSTLPHLAVPADEAWTALQALEDQQPSATYLRTGRIWDLGAEPCREADREPPYTLALPILRTAEARQ